MGLRIAVFGDVHGKQNLMYRAAEDWQERNQKSIDLVLQVGDFETITKPEDFAHYYAPVKYHHVSEIAEYCKGLQKAPFFTVFIGGNHEAWGVLQKHNNGGFICPRVYYMGRSNVIDIQGVSIGGLTGVFGREHYHKPLPAEPSYDWKFYREEAVKHLEEKIKEHKGVDILMVHDWVKPFSAIDVQEESDVPRSMKRNPIVTPTYTLVEKYQPDHVFMGHMHKARVTGKINRTTIHALREFRGDGEPHSFKVIEYEPQKGAALTTSSTIITS